MSEKSIYINKKIFPLFDPLRIAPCAVDKILGNDRKCIIFIFKNLILCDDASLSVITVSDFKIIVEMQGVLPVICYPPFS